MKGKQGGEKQLPSLGFMDTGDKAAGDSSGLGELQWVSWDLRNDAPPSDSGKRWAARYTMRSHLDAVTCVAFHPIEQLLVTGSEDRTLKIWSLQQQTRRWADGLWWAHSLHPSISHYHTIPPPLTITPSLHPSLSHHPSTLHTPSHIPHTVTLTLPSPHTHPSSLPTTLTLPPSPPHSPSLPTPHPQECPGRRGASAHPEGPPRGCAQCGHEQHWGHLLQCWHRLGHPVLAPTSG